MSYERKTTEAELALLGSAAHDHDVMSKSSLRDQAKLALHHLRSDLTAAESEIERLRAEADVVRGDLADMYRIHKQRGEALQRPCIHCGYQPKVIVAMDATYSPRAEGGGWPQENDHASM